jgi:hypothetical protein
MGGMGCAATHYDCAAVTLWYGWLLNIFFSSPDATLGDDFGRSAAKATNYVKNFRLVMGLIT